MSLKDHHDYIKRSLENGESMRFIARQLDCHHTTVMSYRDKHLPDVKHIPRGVGAQGLGDGAVTREEILEEQLRELTRDRRRGRKAEVAEERLLQAIEEALATVTEQQSKPRFLVTRDGAALADVFSPGPSPDLDPQAHHRQVVLLSDFHGGEVVDADAVNGLNSYDWDIMEDRVDEVVRSLLSHKRRSPELTGLDVLFVGDMNSGSVHKELAETNEVNAAEGAVRMGYLQGQIVEQLVPHYPDIRVAGVVGNHGRLDIKPVAKNVWSNLDWISYKVTEQYLAAYETVTCNFPKSAALIHKVAGRTCYVWHGDGVRSTMPGVPWGGVMRRVNSIQSTRPERIDHFILGHFHQANVVQGGRIIGNGALKGTDEWVQKSFGAGEPPTQLLLTFDESRERLTDVRYITPTAGLPE